MEQIRAIPVNDFEGPQNNLVRSYLGKVRIFVPKNLVENVFMTGPKSLEPLDYVPTVLYTYRYIGTYISYESKWGKLAVNSFSFMYMIGGGGC